MLNCFDYGCLAYLNPVPNWKTNYYYVFSSTYNHQNVKKNMDTSKFKQFLAYFKNSKSKYGFYLFLTPQCATMKLGKVQLLLFNSELL